MLQQTHIEANEPPQPAREIVEPLEEPKHLHAKLLFEKWQVHVPEFTIGRELPSRALASVLRYLALIEPVGEFEDFRLRLAGTAWLRRFGFEVSGWKLSQLYQGAELEGWRTRLRETLEHGRPVCCDVKVVGDGGMQLHSEMLSLPVLSPKAGNGCALVGLFHYDWIH
ncbi:MAG: PAS domain-containing protein [Alphaproteobacteria bacterium]|nr:PAS domain-containing protein [Alphaproteobacteria bacterium]